MIGDTLLSRAQQRAFAAARIHLNLGQEASALPHLALAIDWDDTDLYQRCYGYDGLTFTENDIMARDWFYVDPVAGFVLGHPDTVEVFHNSNAVYLVDAFERRQPSMLRVDTAAALDVQLSDLIFQQSLPDDPDDDDEG